MTKKLKIGVLGCANIAQRMVIPTLLKMEEYELIAVSSRNEEKAVQFARQFNSEAITGYENMVKRDDIDMVYIPLPISMHEEWAIKCLESGKHVLSEKSLTTNYASAEKMLGAAQKNAKLLMENFMFKYHSQQEYLANLLKEGAIGDVRCFRSSFGFPIFNPENNIRYKKELGGGALLDAGAYTVKGAQLVLGDDLAVNGAFAHKHPDFGVDFYGGAFLSSSKNDTFAELAWGFDNFYQCNYEIWGSKGKIIMERAFTAGPGFKPKIIIENQDKKQELLLPADNHFVKILRHFHQAIVDDDLENHYRELLRQAKLLDTITTLMYGNNNG